LDILVVGMEHLCHGRARNVGTLLGQSAFVEIFSRMLGVSKIYVGDDNHDSSVGFLGQTFVLATVARLHMENGNVQPLCRDGGKAGVGIAEDKQSIGLNSVYKLIGAVYDVAHGFAEIVADGVHIYLGRIKRKVLKEHAVKVVIVILPRMGENGIEIRSALIYDGGKADYLGTGAHDDKQL
jgi:hypothetical protein